LKKSLWIIFLVLLADQALKFYIKLTMTVGEKIPVIKHFFYLFYTENNGMAFGMQFAGDWGKLFLSLFRILAVIALGIFLVYIIKHKKSNGLIICVSLIFAGAMGNIIDSAFYGMIFTSSTYYSVAHLVAPGHGYAPFLHGKVVDMLYFPIIDISRQAVPSWIPDFLFGPDGRLVFFRPIFNISDSAITVGIFWWFLFQRNTPKK